MGKLLARGRNCGGGPFWRAPVGVPAIEVFRLAIVAVMILLAVPLASASQVRSLNLEEITQRAARVFSGRCLETHDELDARLGLKVSVATFRVDQGVKGIDGGSTVTVRMLLGETSSPVATPRFRKDEDVILFLYGESALGLTSPVGMGQGRFQLISDKLGHRLAINSFGNANLFRGLSPEASRRLGPEALRSTDPKDLGATDLLQKVQALLSLRL